MKQRIDLDFGGVSVFFLGDILQLKPVRARHIFEEPMNENFKLCHMILPLWNKFDMGNFLEQDSLGTHPQCSLFPETAWEPKNNKKLPAITI